MDEPWDDDMAFDDREDDCEHEDVEIDWEGRSVCHRCGHAWWASSEEIEAQDRRMREYAAWENEQARKFNAWWRRLGRWIYHHLPRFTSQQIPF